MTTTPRITGLIDATLGDWRGQVYGLVNPQVSAIYTVVPIANAWYYTKAINAGDSSTTTFVGPWSDSGTALSQMNAAKIRDGF